MRPTATIGILAALAVATALTFGQQPPDAPPDAPRDAAGHEAAPTHFLEVPFADSTIGIYRGTRNPDIFLAFPACLLAADPTADSPTPIPWVRQRGRDVELQLVNASASIRDAQLSAINNRLRQLNQPEISVDRISLLHLTYFSFAVTNDDLAAHVEPYFLPVDNKPANLRLDGMQSIRLRCNGDEIAQKLASMLRDPDEIVRFRIRMIAHGSRYEGVEVEITGQQLAQTAAFNSIMPTADTTIPVAVSQEQMAQITRNALRELNVSVVADLNMAAQALAPADLMALIDRFQRQISEDHAVALADAEKMTQTYIDGESFAPDRIRREASKISEALTHAASSAIDTFEERIRNGETFDSNEDIRDALHHAVNSTDVGVDTKIGVSWGFGAVNVDNNVRVNTSRNVFDNVRNEARQAGFTRFSDETRDALHRAMTNYFNRVSNVESEWDGEKIVPKTLKLRRIVRENLRTAGRLYFAKRQRIVSSDTYEWNRTDEPRYLTVAEPTQLVALQRELHDYRHRYQFEIDRLAQNHAAAMAAMQQTHETTIAAMQRRMAELTAAHEMNADDTQRELKATVGEWQQRHDALREEWQQRHQAELANLQREHAAAIAALQQAHEIAIAAMQQEHETAIATMRREQGTVSRAELDAARAELQADLARIDDFTNRLASEVVTNSIGMPLRRIRAGTFTMGDPEQSDNPPHQVTLTKDFYIGVYPVTNAQYRQFKRDHNSGSYGGHSLNGDDQPVVNVTWEEAVAFCEWLSRKEGRTYRLPTEAEWEYCCRAGRSTEQSKYPWGPNWPPTGKAGNYRDATAARVLRLDSPIEGYDDGYAVTSPVGRFDPNPWGLYDMGGNVWEWCLDAYNADFCKRDATDPLNQSGSSRVLRGASWLSNGRNYLRAASRNNPSERLRVNFGFRLVVC